MFIQISFAFNYIELFNTVFLQVSMVYASCLFWFIN